MFSSTPASMSSSASAFGSPLLLGQTPIGYPSPFSTPASPFRCASLRGGGVVPSSVQSNDFKNPFARTDSTVPNPITPSVPSNLFSVTVTPPTIGQCSFMNHVKPNLESVLDKMEEWEKSTQLTWKVVKHFQEDMKSWMERDRSLEMATQTINQLREELARVTRSKEAIIAEYLASPDFTKRLDEEHEKRLSKIFHPCYVKALGEVQTKFPDINPFTFQRPATGWLPTSPLTPFFSHNPNSGHA